MSWYLITLLLACTLSVSAQTSAITDPITGISFSRYNDARGFSFGIALPELPESDFIGQIVAPITETGYAGVSLGATMANKLLLVAYPNGESVTSGLRVASGYTNPAAYSGTSSPKMSTIQVGTSVNYTHMTYTFLCQGCILGGSLTFEADDESVVLGWAVSSSAVSDPASSSATLKYHDIGFGGFGLNLTAAKSADYENWAALASSSPGNGGNSTIPGTGGNSTCQSTSYTNSTTVVSNATYDYIVAGAGPAGIITAQRLVESGKSVLLIERGAASTYASGGKSLVAWNDTVTQYDVPGLAYYLSSAADTSEYCNDTASQAGCILGGGTVVNALMFVRPQDKDFDAKWPAGWKSKDVSGAASRLYDRNPGTTLASENGRRYDQAVFAPVSKLLNSMGWAKHDAIESPNEKHMSYTYPPWDIQGGKRAGPVKSYLPLAKTSSNFQLSLNTKVIRAVRNGTHVSGVEVETPTGERQIINVKANGKVILASGALSTPRILFNSGIGPTSQLETVFQSCNGVTLPPRDQWLSLPVGAGIKDHPIFTLPFAIESNCSNATSLGATDFTSPSATNIDLFAQGSGPLAQSGQRLVFWSSRTDNGATRFFQGTCAPSAGGFKLKLYLTHGATSSGTLGIEASGNTVLSSSPLMTTAEDQAAVASFIDDFLASVRNSSTITYSGKATDTGASIAKEFISGSHFVGSAKMGLDDGRENGTAVVDTDTKVYGMQNLFVVDASMHPDLPTGNTQAMVMVAAEKAVEKILALDGLMIGGGAGQGYPTSLPRRSVRGPKKLPVMLNA